MDGYVSDVAMFHSSERCQHLSAANTKFALDLYKYCASRTDQNIFMSPLSISASLAMTYLGARGQTKSQMRDALHFNALEEDNLHQAFADIMSALNKPDQSCKLYMANRLFGDNSYTFLNEFLSAGNKHYAAEVAPVDFRNDSSEAATIINNWVAEKTGNKITNVIEQSTIDNHTALILINAVYFKGDWLNKFDSGGSSVENFHVSSIESVPVKMMFMEEVKFNYGVSRQLHCQAIELPYVGNTASMFVILPDRTATSLAEVEKQLTSDDLVCIEEKFGMALREGRLLLPRFRLDEPLSLEEALSCMGMKDLFKEGDADLSGIDGTNQLYVSRALHRAACDVTEIGTEAAAAATMTMHLCSFEEDLSEFCFVADHPFIFLIQDKLTRSILFLGRLLKPPALELADLTLRERRRLDRLLSAKKKSRGKCVCL